MARLPGRPFQRLAQAQQTWRENNPGTNADGVPGLLSGGNPLSNFGLGLLAAARPRPVGTSSFGSRLAEAAQFASQRQQDALRNQLIREQMLERKRQQQAQRDFAGLLSQTAITQGPSREVPGIGGESLGTIPGRMDVVPRIQTPEGREEAIGLLAQFAPGQAAREAFRQPERPTGLDARLQDIEGYLGRRLNEEEALTIAGGGSAVTVNVGDKRADKAIPTNELRNMRDAEGNTLPLGTTYSEAEAAGARAFTNSELESSRQIDSAIGAFNRMEQLALDPNDGVFVGIPANQLGRYAAGIGHAIGDFFGSGQSIRRDAFLGLQKGTLAPMARTLGEVGALAEGDVARVDQLLADLEGVPESEKVARAKFAELRTILFRAARNVGVDPEKFDASTSGDTVDLGAGVTLQFLDE